jgi:hypothetical protein
MLRMLVKSARRAKSTVDGAALITTGTNCPPACGTRLAEVIVTRKDSTSQTGASVPKTTTDPGGVGAGGPGPPFDPHPTISAAAKATERPGRSVTFRLLIRAPELQAGPIAECVMRFPWRLLSHTIFPGQLESNYPTKQHVSNPINKKRRGPGIRDRANSSSQTTQTPVARAFTGK